MATEAAQQVLDSAVERSGLSIVTATKTATDPRFGSIYRPDLLAAAVPVWFHPLQTGSYLGLFRQRWTGATIGSGGPQTYSAKTVSIVPSWATINPATGATEAIAEIPSDLSGVRVLNSAVSRVNYIFTIGTVDSVPHLVHYRVDPLGQLILQGEEVLLPTDTDVKFDTGCYIDGRWLVVFGTDPDGLLYRARKHWGRIGVATDPRETWTYHGEKGWYAHASELVPEHTAGDDIIAGGNLVTAAKYRNRTYIAVMNGSQADIYSARDVDPIWREHPVHPAGSWVYLQPQLYYTTANLPEGASAGIPYVSTTIDGTAGATSLNVAWGMLGV